MGGTDGHLCREKTPESSISVSPVRCHFTLTSGIEGKSIPTSAGSKRLTLTMVLVAHSSPQYEARPQRSKSTEPEILVVKKAEKNSTWNLWKQSAQLQDDNLWCDSSHIRVK